MKYIQTKNVHWLDTPKDTIWITREGSDITPEDVSLRSTPFGVDLQLIDDEDLFENI